MTTEPSPDRTGIEATPLVQRFPSPGKYVSHAYGELRRAVDGTREEKRALNDLTQLPRPWDPSTCLRPELREDLWKWLDAVVLWLNHEHSWDLDGAIPNCWPQHPHLVREIALLADQRRRAGFALSSDPLEDFHRYAMPAFVERMRVRLRSHCEEGHQSWPGRGRHSRAMSEEGRSDRSEAFVRDLQILRALSNSVDSTATSWRVPLVRLSSGQLLDMDTGEIHDE